MKIALWVHLRTSEIKPEYCFFKDVKRIVFMVLGTVEMMRFVARFGFREITGLHAVTAVWYDASGDYSNAALSAAACIPLAGIAAAGAKFASKGVKAAKAANKFGNAASVAKKTISSLKKGVGEAAAKVADAVYASTKSGKKTVAVKVADKVQSAVSTVKKSISDGWNKLKSAFGSKGSAKSADVKNVGAETLKTNVTSGNGYSGYQAPKITTNARGELTNGKFTLDAEGMVKHTDGTVGKSQFLYDVDANKAVLDASAYADEYNLWRPSSGNPTDFADKAKVYVENGPVGVTGQGALTSHLNIHRTKTGYVHGCPGNP